MASGESLRRAAELLLIKCTIWKLHERTGGGAKASGGGNGLILRTPLYLVLSYVGIWTFSRAAILGEKSWEFSLPPSAFGWKGK